MVEGNVFNIQKYCMNDGKGIRTTVFLKGCIMRCIWCHNPESQSFDSQIGYIEDKCIYCKACEAVCPNHCHRVSDVHIFDRTQCVSCGKCAGVCPTPALSLIGRKMSVEEVVKCVIKDRPFYEATEGGITISGGEPYAQPAFLLALLKRLKEEGLNVNIETSGYTDFKNIEMTLPYVDCFLYDWKETNPENHKKWTGVDNILIENNLKRLNAAGKKIVLRCPIIPGYNDRTEHFQKIAELASSLENVIAVNVEPYHPLGISKNKQIGQESMISLNTFPQHSDVEFWIKSISAGTNKIVTEA